MGGASTAPRFAGGVGAVTGGARSNAGMTTGVEAFSSGGGMYDFVLEEEEKLANYKSI